MPARDSKPRARRKGTLAIVAGAALVLVGAGFVIHARSGPSASDGATSASTDPSASTTRHTPTGSSSSATTVPRPTSHSKPEYVANPVGAQCIPKLLSVSRVGISDEAVVPMGTNAQGQIYPPAHTTMWYDRSPQPGQRGISVIAGHVTYDGPDNFYNLRNVRVGTRVTVVCTNNKAVRLEVTHMESVLKTKLTTDQRVWGRSAKPVVTLITCDLKSPMVAGHHLNNFVVWTKPAA